MGITYNAGTNTVTVTGYTEGTPCNFLDVYNADITGSWGVVTRQCLDQYCFGCKLQIGDGSVATWFADTSKQLIWEAGNVGQYQDVIKIKSNAHFRLGVLVDEAQKETIEGCSILDLNGSVFLINTDATGIQCELYSCLFTGNDTRKLLYFPGASSSTKCYNDICTNGYEYNPFAGSTYNLSLTDSLYGIARATGPIDRMDIKNVSVWAIYSHAIVGVGTGYFRNLIIRNSPITFYMDPHPAPDQFMINCDVDTWNVAFCSGATGNIWRQNEFDLKVQKQDEVAISGATVKITDKDGAVVTNVTTDAQGEITTQTLNYGYYDLAHGSTAQMKTPHVLEISKAGYETYKTVFTIDVKIDWTVRLLRAMPVRQCDNDLILQLRPESQEADRFIFTEI